MGSWLVFDDETVDTIKESDIPKYFGESNAGSAYVLYYQAVDLDLVALDLHRINPQATEAHSHQRLPTDSPASISQPIPLPPGLSAEPVDADKTETAPLPPPPSLPVDVPVLPAERSPRKIPPEFMMASPPSAHSRAATIGPGSAPKASLPARNGILKHVPSLRVSADKRDTTAKPSSFTPFPKDESPEPITPVAALASPNGKEIEKKSGNWFRRKSLKSGGKSRPSLEVGPEKPPLPPDVLLDVSASPTRIPTSGPTPKHSKDDGSRRPPDSANLDRPVAPFMVNRRPVSASGMARSQSTSTRQGGSPSISDTISYSSHTTSTSSSISTDLHSIRPLPSIPASPQNSRIAQSPPAQAPPSAFHRGHSSEHPRPYRRPAVSPSDFEPPKSLKPSARPTTAGASLGSGSSTFFTRDHNLPPLPNAATDDTLNGNYGNTSTLSRLDEVKLHAQVKTRSSEEGAGFSGRPKSAHSSTLRTGSYTSPSPSPSTNGNIVKRASRKLSFTASFPFGRRDRQREKERVQE